MMGIYSTTTSLSIMMIGTTFDSATTSLVAKAITHAENEVNKYLSKRYDLSSSPFNTSTSIPPLVTSLTEQLAMGYSYWWMSRGGKESIERGKSMIKEAKDNLNSIMEYKMDVVDSTGDVVTDMSQTAYRIQSSTVDYTDTFAEDSELSWAVDTDKLNDIEDSRD